MAIHSVDKNANGRGNPTPNTHDTIGTPNRMAHGTNSINYLPPGQPPSSQTSLKSGQYRPVLTDQIELINNGGTLTTTTVPHNLGYAPTVKASLNDSTVTGIPGLANLELPTFTQATISGGNVTFQTWLYTLSDDTYVYFQFLNATGTPITLTLTYYLFQQAALN